VLLLDDDTRSPERLAEALLAEVGRDRSTADP
jgi:hypothetical protein